MKSFGKLLAKNYEQLLIWSFDYKASIYFILFITENQLNWRLMVTKIHLIASLNIYLTRIEK